MATSFLSCGYFKCKHNSKLEIKKKKNAVIFLCSPVLTIFCVLSSLWIWEVLGKGESRGGKEGETDVGQERQRVTERNKMDWDKEPRAGAGVTTEDTQNGSRFPLFFSSL